MKVLLVGAGGQLGRALARCRPDHVELAALTRTQLDVGDAAAVMAAVAAHAPRVVINAAAYTQVDAAEAAPAQAELINATACGYLAGACRAHGARLVQVSTDYVFDGTANVPYLPDAPTAPQNVYGASKRRGEQQVIDRLGDAALILRTSWLYDHEGRNFVTRMLELMATRPELGVVVDQVGAPTAADDLAASLWLLAGHGLGGVHHWCNSGIASWYDFAVAIGEEARACGLLDAAPVIRPILSAAYPTPAKRPHYSVLDKNSTEQATGRTADHWRDALRRVLALRAASGKEGP